MLRRVVLISCLFLCVADLYLWIRTFRSVDDVDYLSASDTLYSVSTYKHGIAVQIFTHRNSYPPTYNPISSDAPRQGWSFWTKTYAQIEDEQRRALEEIELHEKEQEKELEGTNVRITHVTGTATYTIPMHGCLGVLWYTNSPGSTWQDSSGRTISQSWTTVSISVWPVLAVFLIPITIELALLLRRRRRRAANLCPVCGYDLRYSPDRCPECGSARSEKSAQLPA